MKVLLVTEKFNPHPLQRDGGSRLVQSLLDVFGEKIEILQFSSYPISTQNRFLRRVENASFIGEKVQKMHHAFTHVCFVHVSMQFGLVTHPLPKDKEIWTFPMFLSPSYQASQEEIPTTYRELEKKALLYSTMIVTPSYLEKEQLIQDYQISEEKIHLIPRGIQINSFSPFTRKLDKAPRFCSIGSIKKQKNTIELISLFALIKEVYSDASLSLIGPIQDESYGSDVKKEIENKGLMHAVEITGYVPPEELGDKIRSCHLHFSTSQCETFGRSIFETLGAGIPNIVKKTYHAAFDFLSFYPYISFFSDANELLSQVGYMLKHLSILSQQAQEIGSLYDDRLLARLLKGKLCNGPILAISDFDGTLYHKENKEKTRKSIERFHQFPVRVICSARPIEDVLQMTTHLKIVPHWIIGYSGCVIADGKGESLMTFPLKQEELLRLRKFSDQVVSYEEEILQLVTQKIEPLLGFRVESYQETHYIFSWETSKLKAIHWLLCYLEWEGQVAAFGDGRYDIEFLTYFHGKRGQGVL